MYEIKIVSQFAAAHQLRNYCGGCEKLHGHNWKVEVRVTGKMLDDDGLLIDFRKLKDKTKNILDELDHEFLNDLDYFEKINPSSENIARLIFEKLSKDLNEKGISISRVSAWESDTSCATYFES